MDCKFLIFDNIDSANELNSRITNNCIEEGVWQDGITNNYCNPIKHPTEDKWAVVIDDNYVIFFTSEELQNSTHLTEDWFNYEQI
jgi:hypothetical protein